MNKVTTSKIPDIFFSVVIPTYNRGDSFKKCLDSLVDQTYTFFEVIICDDGSTDNTKIIIEPYKSKLNITYIYEENWGGPAKPRNNGIKSSKGEWICFLDSDDSWYNNKLETVYNYILMNPQVEVVCHDLMMKSIISGETNLISCGPVVPNLYKNLLKNGNKFQNSGITVKKSVLYRYNIMFRELKELISVEDYDFSLQLASYNVIFGCINSPLGEYLIGKDSISQNSKHLQNLEFLLKKHVFEFQVFETDKLKLWTEVYSRFNIIRATSSYRQKDYRNFLKFFLKAIKTSKIVFFSYFYDRIKLALKRIRYKIYFYE